MRFYDGNIIRRGLERRIRRHSESRDAIVWDMDETNQLVRCKIQGSNEYILCHYPRNYQTLPPWCKRGNAVRIAHKGGTRGFLEVVGNGRAIPSPVYGSQLPTPEDLADVVLTGGTVVPFSGMTVEIGATTYRIANIIYSVVLDGIQMLADPLMTMGDGLPMGGSSAYLTFDAAPSAPQCRYDLIVAGTDGIAEIVKGTASASPTMPSVPANHVKIAHVLILGGATSITDENINGMLETRQLNSITWVFSDGTGDINGDGEFVWHITEMHPYCTLTLTFLCQYGWAFVNSYTIDLSLLDGTGEISLDHSTWTTDKISKTLTSDSTAVFYYRRDEEITESSPIFQADAVDTIISGVGRLTLLDAVGDPI